MTRKSRIIFYSIFSLINISIFIILLLRDNAYKLPFFLTLHSFWSNCFYFVICLILEIRAELKNIYSEKLLPFMQNTYFKFSFTLTCFVTIDYYLYVLLGSSFMKFPDNFTSLSITIFLHGGEFIFVIIEFYAASHSFIPSYAKDITILKIYFILYFLLSILAMNSQIYAYEFMKITSTTQNLVIYLVSIIFLFNFYMLYQWLTHRKNKNVLKDTISIRRINSSEDTNNSSNININDKEMNFIDGDLSQKSIKRSSVNDKNSKNDFDNDKIKRNILTNY